MRQSSSSHPTSGEEVSASLKQSTWPSKPVLGMKSLRREKAHLLAEQFGYKDDNNPFGDQQLSEPFIWKKKHKTLRATGQVPKVTAERILEQSHAKVDEILSVKRRREQSELEEALLVKQREDLAREREQEHYADILLREKKFLYEQSIKKSEIRIEQGRSRPEDVALICIRYLDGAPISDWTHPDQPLLEQIKGMDSEELKETLKALQMHVSDEASELDRKYEVYWKSLLLIVQNQLLDASPMGVSSVDRTGVSDTIIQSVDAILRSKSFHELCDLDKQVATKLQQESDELDPSFWELIQEKLPLYKAYCTIESLYTTAVKKLESQKSQTEKFETKDSPVDLSDKLDMEASKIQPSNQSDLSHISASEEDTYLTIGSRSPTLLPFESFKGDKIFEPLEAHNERENEKKRICKVQIQNQLKICGVLSDASQETDVLIELSQKPVTFDEFVRNEKKNMGTDEEIMAASGEQKLKHNPYDWEDKYRPRKPRFFNRIKTGYEWNKYNQTHYDHDNPPPKSVQGYKFNIFYPDLIDKSSTPSWHLEPSDTPDTLIIRFHAGPPYEDVAFKIINREWSVDQFRGFRNTFERGILQLYFSFKRFRYRR